MKLLALDGNSILNRSFYGIRLLTTKSGEYTNAIYGFLTVLNKLNEDVAPDAVAIAFDMHAPTFRHKEYDGYKAGRKGMPPELFAQMEPLKEILRAMGYTLVECEGFEADDILGTLAQAAKENGDTCVIATGDRDALQLVGDGVTVRLTATKQGRPEVTYYDEAKILEDYGVTPKQLIEIKALQGDTSDNIPGVAGIGPKTAGDLIQKFGSVEAIYRDLDTLDVKPAVKKKLEAGRESAKLSRFLGEINTHAPIETKIPSYVVGPGDKGAAARLLAKYELFSLIERLGLAGADGSAPKEAEQAQEKALCLEETDESATLTALRAGKAAYAAPVFDENGALLAAVASDGNTLFLLKENAQSLFTDSKIPVVCHDGKPIFKALKRQGATMENEKMDVMLAAYLLNPSASGYDMDRLAQEYAVPVPAVKAPEPYEAAAKAAALLPGLSGALAEHIVENKQEFLLTDIEQPLSEVLADMELTGFRVDVKGIEEFGDKLQKEIDTLQRDIYELVGYEFNLNSPKQLGEALFIKLGLPAKKKTKSGYSTSADVLEELAEEHPAVQKLLDYRHLAKLKSTYCDGLLKVVEENGRVNSTLNQTETRTGRISSTEPNLQNIPIRTELGREMRRFFLAKEGWVLVDADYSQIELRVLAHIAGDKTMIEAFRSGTDIHTVTASQVFGVPQELVTPLMRSRAKAVNFGIVYGIGAFSLAKNIHVSRYEASQYIKNYLNTYSGVRDYMDRVVSRAKEDGFVETIFGRRRYLPELTSSNANLRAFGERVARNMPIQGAAADIIKIAMIRVSRRLREEGLKARLILQVHDELIVEAPEDEAQEAARILKEEMEGAAQMDVCLSVDVNTGKTWYDAH